MKHKQKNFLKEIEEEMKEKTKTETIGHLEKCPEGMEIGTGFDNLQERSLIFPS